MYIYVLVASMAEVKLKAVQNVFKKRFTSHTIVVHGLSTNSGVHNQPINYETDQGCQNRMDQLMQHVKNKKLNYHFLVSIENGIDDSTTYGNDMVFDFCRGLICHKDVVYNASVSAHTPIHRDYLQQSLNTNQTKTVGQFISDDHAQDWHNMFLSYIGHVNIGKQSRSYLIELCVGNAMQYVK